MHNPLQVFHEKVLIIIYTSEWNSIRTEIVQRSQNPKKYISKRTRGLK